MSNDAQCGGPHEHAMADRTVKVALALDAAIVLAGVLLELYADPVAGSEKSAAEEADDGIAAVGQLHDLTDS